MSLSVSSYVATYPRRAAWHRSRRTRSVRSCRTAVTPPAPSRPPRPLISATARRLVSPDPASPIAVILSWAHRRGPYPWTGPRDPPAWSRTHRSRSVDAPPDRAPMSQPPDRLHNRATVFGKHPASSVASRNDPVRSNPSRISMITSPRRLHLPSSQGSPGHRNTGTILARVYWRSDNVRPPGSTCASEHQVATNDEPT